MNDSDDALAHARSVLGIGLTEDLEVIRKAFRRRSMETHPDRGGSAEEFAAVKEAYAVLLGQTVESGGDWFVDEPDDEVDVRVVDEETRPRRRRFEEMFLEALRREYRDDNE